MTSPMGCFCSVASMGTVASMAVSIMTLPMRWLMPVATVHLHCQVWLTINECYILVRMACRSPRCWIMANFLHFVRLEIPIVPIRILHSHTVVCKSNNMSDRSFRHVLISLSPHDLLIHGKAIFLPRNTTSWGCHLRDGGHGGCNERIGHRRHAIPTEHHGAQNLCDQT